VPDADGQRVVAVALGEPADQIERLPDLADLVRDRLAAEDERLVGDVVVIEETDRHCTTAPTSATTAPTQAATAEAVSTAPVSWPR
jgi:hypothetical protein